MVFLVKDIKWYVIMLYCVSHKEWVRESAAMSKNVSAIFTTLFLFTCSMSSTLGSLCKKIS